MSSDDEIFPYTSFKKNFLAAKEMVEHIAVFKRASPGAHEHSYQWMYSTCRAVLNNERREQVSSERIAAHKSGATEPATIGLGNKDNDKKNKTCPSLLKSGKCDKTNCPYNHKKNVIAAAASDKGKNGGGKGDKGKPDEGKLDKGKGKGYNEKGSQKGSGNDK